MRVEIFFREVLDRQILWYTFGAEGTLKCMDSSRKLWDGEVGACGKCGPKHGCCSHMYGSQQQWARLGVIRL
jgi:hypothetical protein